MVEEDKGQSLQLSCWPMLPIPKICLLKPFRISEQNEGGLQSKLLQELVMNQYSCIAKSIIQTT